jgi:hypothetical protein
LNIIGIIIWRCNNHEFGVLFFTRLHISVVTLRSDFILCLV